MDDLGSVEDSAIKEEESVILDNEDNLNLDHVPMVYKAHVAVGIVIFMEGHFPDIIILGEAFRFIAFTFTKFDAGASGSEIVCLITCFDIFFFVVKGENLYDA